MMKAVEIAATVDCQGQLVLDEPLKLQANTRVRTHVLIKQ